MGLCPKPQFPHELYNSMKSENPLWTKGLSINAIRGFLLLHQIAEKEDINPHDYLDAYIADVRGGTSVSEAYDKQEARLKTN